MGFEFNTVVTTLTYVQSTGTSRNHFARTSLAKQGGLSGVAGMQVIALLSGPSAHLLHTGTEHTFLPSLSPIQQRAPGIVLHASMAQCQGS